MSVIIAMEQELGTELEIVPTLLLLAMDGEYITVIKIYICVLLYYCKIPFNRTGLLGESVSARGNSRLRQGRGKVLGKALARSGQGCPMPKTLPLPCSNLA